MKVLTSSVSVRHPRGCRVDDLVDRSSRLASTWAPLPHGVHCCPVSRRR